MAASPFRELVLHITRPPANNCDDMVKNFSSSREREMKFRTLVAALVVLLFMATRAHAQQQTGEIFGKATDQSGAVMPGVTVTLTSPILLQRSSQRRAIRARISFHGSRWRITP